MANNTSFHIARRYLIAKKGSNAVTFITRLAAIAMMTAVASMFIIVSVFSGLEDLNKEMISNLHADLTISSKKDKKLASPETIVKVLEENPDILAFSKLIEEKVYLNYNGQGEIAYLRAVDSLYTKVNPVDQNIFFGTYPNFKFENQVMLENGLDNRLEIPVGESANPPLVYMPKAGVGLINNEDDIFTKTAIEVTGVFPGNDQMDSYIIAPISLAQELLNLNSNDAYRIVIKLQDPLKADIVRKNLKRSLGENYNIKTKSEENAAFWKMINTEKMMIYLIFALVIFITTFNLAGAIIILQLDKKEQAKSLISLGLPLSKLRRIYFYTGILITTFGVLLGLILGTIICLFQISTGVFKAGIELPFPVKISLENYFIVAGVALAFGLAISWIFSKINRSLIFKR